jgi:hypothetical protein
MTLERKRARMDKNRMTKNQLAQYVATVLWRRRDGDFLPTDHSHVVKLERRHTRDQLADLYKKAEAAAGSDAA